MSLVVCNTCGHQWNAANAPTCSVCQVRRWGANPDLLKMKHDPTKLPNVESKFRSVVSYDIAANTASYLDLLATSGSWAYDVRHAKWFTMSASPLGLMAGSPIGRGASLPTGGELDTLMIVDSAGSNAHLFADDIGKLRGAIASGYVIAISKCSRLGCDNLIVPGFSTCCIHKHPPDVYRYVAT